MNARERTVAKNIDNSFKNFKCKEKKKKEKNKAKFRRGCTLQDYLV